MEEEKSITTVRRNKQERALELMLRGETDTRIAQALGTTRQSIYHWRTQDTRFMQALAERRSIIREQTREELLELSHSAIEAVRRALASQDERVQLQAARMVLNMLKIDREDELEQSPVLELLSEAIGGIKDQLGLDKPI